MKSDPYKCIKVKFCSMLFAIGLTLSSFAQDTQPSAPAAQDGTQAVQQNAPAAQDAGGGIDCTISIKGLGDYKNNMAVLAMPGQKLSISLKTSVSGNNDRFVFADSAKENGALDISVNEKITLNYSAGKIENADNKNVDFVVSDKPGTHKLTFGITRELVCKDQSGKEEKKTAAGNFTLNILAGYPSSMLNKGVIEGYPIGNYPNPDSPKVKPTIAEHKKSYAVPAYFFKATAENENYKISENFKISDFTVQSEAGKDRFFALDQRLINRLEALKAAADKQFQKPCNIVILRGFLAPNEIDIMNNKGIKLSDFTRYQYGDAAAVIIDNNSDGVLDDLNGDGNADMLDAQVIENMLRDIEKETRVFGGIGVFDKYDDTSHPTTPYVLFDTRGYASRW